MSEFRKWWIFQLQMIELHRILRNEKSFQKWCVRNGGGYDFEVTDIIKRRIENLNNRRLARGLN